jgi:hypothetical protein
MAFRECSRPGLGWLTVAWAIAAASGLFGLHVYSSTPSGEASPPAQWPESSALAPPADRLTIVMLAHPQCACTRASIGELAVAAAQARGRLDIRVVFLALPAFAVESDLWESAVAIPDALVIADPDGAEIRKFGVTASGHVLAYHPDGRLAFSGGIVGARGHAGANSGREALVELARHGRSRTARFPVFGCALQDHAPGPRPAPDESALPAPQSASGPDPGRSRSASCGRGP